MNFKSEEKNNYFAPEWDIDFYQTNIGDKELIHEMRNVILEKEYEIINANSDITHDGGTGLGNKSLTSKFTRFNIFTWQENCFVKFQDFIKENHSKFIKELGIKEEKLWVGCWANVLRQGQNIAPHWHASGKNSYLGAHLCLTENPGTSTIYINPFQPHPLFYMNNRSMWPENSCIEFVNIIGDLTFFPDWMVHYTTPYTGTEERVTIAMDLVVDEQHQKNSTNAKNLNYVRFN